MSKSFFDKLGPDRTNELVKRGIEKAIKEAHEAGVPVTGEIDGVLCRVYPDGRVEPLSPDPTGGEKP